MYTKKFSELRALYIAARVVILAAITAVAGMAFGSTVAIFVLAGGLLLGLLLELRPDSRRKHPLRVAVSEGGRHEGRHVLVVANTPLEGEELADVLSGPAVIDVLAPPLASRLHLAVTDIDRELADARNRLDASLAWAREHGLQARGEVGDADAVAGLADELRGFGADEVVVVSNAAEGRRITRRELERLRADLDVPVREVAI